MSKRRNIGRGIWLALIFSIASMFFIFRNMKGVSLGKGLAGVDWYYLSAGLVLLIIVWVAKAFRMYIISSGMGSKISLWQYFQIYMATCFISHVTPFNSGGTPLQIYLITKQGVTLGKASAITVVDLGLNTMMFILLTLIAVLTNIGMLNNSDLFEGGFQYHWVLWVLILGVAGYALRMVYRKNGNQMRHWVKLRSFIERKGWLHHLRHEYVLFKEGWNLMVKENPANMLWAILATIIYWLFYLLLAPIVIWALGERVSFLGIMGWQLFINFAQIFIPTPGGSGGSELMLSYFFKGIVGAELIGVFVLLWKIYTFFSTLFIGSVFFIKLTGAKSS